MSNTNLDPVIIYPLKRLLQYPFIFLKLRKLCAVRLKIGWVAVLSIFIVVNAGEKLVNVQNCWINVDLIGAEILNKVRSRMRKSFPG